MMIRTAVLTLFLLIVVMHSNSQTSIHEFSFTTIDGSEKSFADFKGKKLMIVNTASECGFTSQYKALQEMHEKYADKLTIVGFPANNYGAQEPGSNETIATFCQKNYGVAFTMAEKVSVNGDDIHPIFKWLCEQKNPSFTGAIKWNFEKFILDENGVLLDRFRSITSPDDKKIIKLIE